MPLTFVISQKGQKQLLLDGYLFSRKTVNNNSVTWRCVNYYKENCKAIVHTDSEKRTGNVVGEKPNHEHAGDPSSIAAKKLKNKICQRGAQNNDPPSLVIGDALSNVSSPVVARLPKMESMSRSVQRVRKFDKVVEPSSCKDLIIPDDLCVTAKGENMLFHDSGMQKKRILMFTTATNLRYLSQCSQWAADGTFSSVPSIFYQLYSIHGSKTGKMLPLVFFLLPNKTLQTYQDALTILKNRLPTLRPERVMLDFESAAHNAFQNVFPDAQLSGCLFHYGQSLWRHLQSIGLQCRYNNDVRFALNIRMLIALSCVPVDDVCQAFDKLVDSKYFKDNEEELRELLNYFERTWVGVLSRSGKKRLKPYFSLRMWNVYEAIINDYIRTNNAVEAWHNSFRTKVRFVHPSFNQFVEFIKNEQSKTSVLMTQDNTGLGINGKRKRLYIDIDYRLKNIVLAYDVNDVVQYLHNVAAILRI